MTKQLLALLSAGTFLVFGMLLSLNFSMSADDRVYDLEGRVDDLDYIVSDVDDRVDDLERRGRW
ncbi:MAG: hypothetical protein OQL28_15935 [Sedimenticola sp.]|nr:hypothetical protein [Sedimenticola sp.]